MNSTYSIRDIVILRPEYGGGIGVIVDINPRAPANPFLIVDCRRGGKRIKTGPQHFLRKLGQVNEGDPLLTETRVEQLAADPIQQQTHERFCETMASMDQRNANHWKYLHSVKPGDPVVVAIFGRPQTTYAFVRVLTSGHRYHFAAENAAHKGYKFPINALQIPKEQHQTPLPRRAGKGSLFAA